MDAHVQRSKSVTSNVDGRREREAQPSSEHVPVGPVGPVGTTPTQAASPTASSATPTQIQSAVKPSFLLTGALAKEYAHHKPFRIATNPLGACRLPPLGPLPIGALSQPFPRSQQPAHRGRPWEQKQT